MNTQLQRAQQKSFSWQPFISLRLVEHRAIPICWIRNLLKQNATKTSMAIDVAQIRLAIAAVGCIPLSSFEQRMHQIPGLTPFQISACLASTCPRRDCVYPYLHELIHEDICMSAALGRALSTWNRA
jgi:hypothetical protein